ncbi:hypothetical protein [Clostridium sp. UBA1652]|uniref:hypothetical protein n=1 Tax=Clostridium sp. UBA1652 TaxID=1946348 RepID=UPI00257F8C4E|nr:hypothetical protein [Clostridium sp. UBA1652]
MGEYNTPMISQVNNSTQAIKPGVAVPVAAIYAAVLTTVAISVQFAVQAGAVLWNAVAFW